MGLFILSSDMRKHNMTTVSFMRFMANNGQKYRFKCQQTITLEYQFKYCPIYDLLGNRRLVSRDISIFQYMIISMKIISNITRTQKQYELRDSLSPAHNSDFCRQRLRFLSPATKFASLQEIIPENVCRQRRK